MTLKVLKYLGHFILLVFLQSFVFRNILLFGILHPIIYLYFILILPQSMNRNLLLLIAFFVGLSVDIFSNTYGLHISSMLFVAFFKDIVLKAISGSDSGQEELRPHIRTMGLRSFTLYLVLMVFIHHFVLYFLHQFGVSNIFFTIYKVIVNTIFSSIVIFAYELILFYNNRETE